MNYLGYVFRLQPTPEQATLLLDHCYADKFIYNKLLEYNLKNYQETGKFPIFDRSDKYGSRQLREEHPWLKASNSQSAQQAEKKLWRAFDNRFSKNRKTQAGFPKFQSRHWDTLSFLVPQHFKIKDGQVYLPKIGWIKMIQHRKFAGKIKSVTIKWDIDQWVGSFLVELPETEPVDLSSIQPDDIVGIDFGITNFLTTSDGEVWNLPESLKKEDKKLRKLARSHSRKMKGGKNRAKARIKLAKQYRRITRIRKDAINCCSKSIAKTYAAVGLETLNIKGMVKNRKLSGKIQQLPWAQFKARLKELMPVHEVSQWFPSSKKCSCCGFVNPEVVLGVNSWACPSCHETHNRDVNAALNLKAEASSVFACGQNMRPSGSMDSSGSLDEAGNNGIIGSQAGNALA